MRYKITCILQDQHHERIQSVGCVDQTGNQHRFNEAEAIALIEGKSADFYVERPDGHAVEVIVEISSEGHKFLKTVADGEKPNNLLSLPRCRAQSPVVVPPRSFTPARSHGA
jgi:hypothetical protein